MTRADAGAWDGADVERVLEHLRARDYEPLTERALLRRLGVAPERRRTARRTIRQLIREGLVVRLSGARIAASRRPRGRGAAPPGGRDARPGSARISLGVFYERGRAGFVRTFAPMAGQVVGIPGSFRSEATDGQVVRLEILRARDPETLEGKVLEVLGRLDDPRTDLPVIAAKYELDPHLPKPVVAEAERLPDAIDRGEALRRTRFDDPPPVTIDGESARDFDDAIAVAERADGGFRLLVHVADVSHFVRPGTGIDAEAFRRGTSVYFPERVLPMLPERLSNDLCSLRPRVARLVHTAILDFDASGKPRGVEFSDGIIRSAARLTYGQVARVLGGEARVPGVPRSVVPMLEAADRLRAVLERRRRERGALDFDLPEPQILLDVDGAITGIRTEPRNLAHRLIEECMIAANEAVAGYLGKRRRACMYRVHDPPDPAKIEVLEDFVRRLGVAPPRRDGDVRPRHVRRMLEAFEGRDEHPVVVQLALRSLSRARYTMVHEEHFGLASRAYCHFTSPIRRYPDLVVHRLLRAARDGAAGEVQAATEEAALACSERERAAEEAEREMLRRKKVAFLAGRVGEPFEGVVTGIAAFGAFVLLDESQLDGLVRAEHLGGDRFVPSADGTELRGTRTRRRIRLGDRLAVRLARVDRVLQRIDLTLAAE